MTISRRSFFAKVAGAVVAARVAPAPGCLAAAAARLTGEPVYGSIGGAHIGVIAGGLSKFDSLGQVAPLPLLRVSDELLEASSIDLSAIVQEWDDA